MSENPNNKEHTWTEEVEIASRELVDRFKDLIAEGNVRRLILRKPNDEVLFEIPLTPAVAVGGVLTLFAPQLAALGALAAFIAEIKIEIIRAGEPPEQDQVTEE